ncbi:D-alanyl-D-alanine carboxypeptidase/D-alanyl-D-alanine-endopeptidase [filamentous cyanobacterium LEGE 11480]|uniref:D-alanyl-D-alanine carboxypeptidase/D-alanyl-D-alanine-endopeptidase n=1 Tax=Romeriopsis navalis LEGE 11480 TaxID=2777977 RepID=A0A928VSE6_9CYAN|nr:D-alanyl-D-alanine carboxypeptidase/D-alanyl-D-alanine-endopeptidase [Romeriopsis navalis]MBE9031690.1 D-alanyl-D-alanine carboxypeptidase/D-alanyl-D-alanine-endopeptidase [Romeriopsis navalis LEGE 11480]
MRYRPGLISLAAITFANLAVPSAAVATQSNAICAIDLARRVDQIINQSAFDRARWGLLIQTLNRQPSRRQTLIDRGSQKYFIPASNAKLLTTAAALQRLGSRYRIRTSILGQQITPGTWDLQVVGRGDPSLDDAKLQQLVQQLKTRGIQQVNRLVLDDRYFGTDLVNPSWDWGDLNSGYGSIANSLIVNLNYHSLTLTPQRQGQPLKLSWNNRNAISGFKIDNQTLTVSKTEPEFINISRDLGQPVLRIRGQLHEGGKPDVADLPTFSPAIVFRDRLNLALKQANIRVKHLSFANSQTRELPESVAFVESAPVAELIRETNTESDNLYAEVLLQTIGTAITAPTTFKITTKDNRRTAGLKVVNQTLEQIGVEPENYKLFDGSGLARMNLVSPQALVQTLQAMHYQPSGQIYRNSLPIAGKTGTLKYRFRNTPAAGIVQAKTGTLTGALSLSGYINPKQYQPLAFSILLNQSTESNTKQRKAIEAIVLLLTQLKDC